MTESGDLRLRTGRTIQLCELNQRRTYDGLLEGLPTSARNRHYLDSLVEVERARPHVLLTPTETPVDMDGRDYPFGIPATLPAITCIGRFQSRSIGEDDPTLYSELTIIWLQDRFALPVDHAIVQAISELDWDTVASNEEI